MIIEQRPPNKSPRESANIINKLFFWWTKDTFRKGVKRTLTLDDIYDPSKWNESEGLADLLEREWYRELEKLKQVEYTLEVDGNKKSSSDTRPCLYKAIFRSFWKSYLVTGILLFINTVVLGTLQPILQGWVINYFNIVPNTPHITKEKAVGYAFGLIINIIFSIIICHHTNLRNQEIGMQIRVACSSLVYRKILRLSKAALTQTASAGKIINILSNDMSRFDQLTFHLHYVWITPIQLVLVTYIMWTMVGVPTFIGILCLLLVVIPSQGFFPIISKRLRSTIALLTDKRVQLMNEFINGIQVIKMYAWEKPFSKFVSETRRAEIRKIKLSSFVRAANVAIAVFTERFILFLSVISFALMNHALSAQHTYILATFFNLLQLSTAIYFPQALIIYNESKISVKRIEELLLLDEAITCEQPALPKPKHNKKEKNGVHNCSIISKNEPVTEVKSEKAASIELSRVSANWVPHTLPPTICNISMKVEAGQLCILLGQVGAGKSALLHVLLKELPLGAGTMAIYQNALTEIESQMKQGYLTDNENTRISYASQEPWLFSGTIRQNILFGQPYDKKKYADVTRVCALNKDFQQLPQGDMSVVGEKGVMLSGGQRARVNLARAVYKEAEIYLLDDPLSAVDAKVARHIFKKCVAGYLNGRTRILATHQLQFLKSADVIVALDHGTIKMKGTYRELISNNEEFVKMITRIKTDQEQEKIKEEKSGEKSFGNNRESVRSRVSIKSTNSSIMEPDFDDYEVAYNEEQEEAIMTEDISWRTYVAYFRNGGSWFALIGLAILMILGQVATSGNDYWLSYWTNLEAIKQAKNQSSSIDEKGEYNNIISSKFLSSFLPLDEMGLPTTKSCIYVYTFCILNCIVFVLARSFFFMEICTSASRKIHDTMFNNVLQANMRFFHMNPSGRILNRFSKDVGAMDELLPKPMIEMSQILLVICGIIIMEIVTNYWIILPLIVLGTFAYFVRRFYLVTAQTIKRFEGVCKSPVFCHVGTTLNGLSTIRCSGKETQNLLLKEFDRLQDKHTGTWYLLIVSSTVLGLVLDIVSWFFIIFITFFFIIRHKDNTLGGDVGLAISQALIIVNTLQYGIKQSVEMFIQMSSIERVFQYMNLPKETSPGDNSPPSTWPSQGRLVLKNVCMRYNQNEPPVLKNLSVTIEAGWKIGVVGRTGAGKSSLISVLFRLFTDGLEGEINIDGIDTSTISLQELRSRISIIPQEPILFAASLRYNLDPFNQYDDVALWDVLREVELTDIGLDQQIVANGNNLSVGQRQLICLARAVLRKNRVIVLDEATANIDSHTDELIQRTLRTKFADCTVLTIAHRLNTIIDSNRILVMDAGEIVEFGSPYELLRDMPHGSFAQMVKNTGRVMSKNLLQQAEMAYRQNVTQRNHESSGENLDENNIIYSMNEEYII